MGLIIWTIEMIDSKNVVAAIPQFPKEVTIFEAAGLIGHFAGKRTKESMLERIRIHDPVVRVYGLSQLLSDSKHPHAEAISIAMHLSRRSGRIRNLLAPILVNGFYFPEFEALKDVEQQQLKNSCELRTELCGAIWSNNWKAQVDCYDLLYLETGDPAHVAKAVEIARTHLDISEAWRWCLRACLMNIGDAQGQLLAMAVQLVHRDAYKELKALGQILHRQEFADVPIAYIAGQLGYYKKNYAGALEFLTKSNVIEAAEKGKLASVCQLIANIYEKLEDYPQAAQWIKRQNEGIRDPAMNSRHYIKDLSDRDTWKIERLENDCRDNYFVMTGFPRSGTTLLENVFAVHPDIATCEETSSLSASFPRAYLGYLQEDPEKTNFSLRARMHRELYYKNLDRYVTKQSPKAVIDKTPIMAANIRYMEKIFPEKCYIFSIRHPYDVVISNYKQLYRQNVAMAAFNDMHTACELYNFVMSNWFDVFPGETDRVYYVRYDELVTDSERVVRGAIAFMNLEWTDEVKNFASHAANRAVKTPSYSKVKQGLTIGIQSSWKNYEFLFDEKCRALLDPWVHRFGYAT